METLLLTLSPIAVALVSQGVKWFLKVGTNLRDSGTFHTSLLRFIVALLSFGSVVVSAILSNSQVDTTSIATFAEALVVFLSATGLFFLAKKE